MCFSYTDMYFKNIPLASAEDSAPNHVALQIVFESSGNKKYERLNLFRTFIYSIGLESLAKISSR